MPSATTMNMTVHPNALEIKEMTHGLEKKEHTVYIFKIVEAYG